MEPGRKIEFHACDPWTFSPSLLSRSPIPGPLFSMVLAMEVSARPSLETEPVGVAVVVVALVLVAVSRGHTGLAEDDDARRAAVDAEGAAGADVLVDHEDHVVVRIEARLHRVGGVGDGVRGEHVD